MLIVPQAVAGVRQCPQVRMHRPCHGPPRAPEPSKLATRASRLPSSAGTAAQVGDSGLVTVVTG